MSKKAKIAFVLSIIFLLILGMVVLKNIKASSAVDQQKTSLLFGQLSEKKDLNPLDREMIEKIAITAKAELNIVNDLYSSGQNLVAENSYPQYTNCQFQPDENDYDPGENFLDQDCVFESFLVYRLYPDINLTNAFRRANKAGFKIYLSNKFLVKPGLLEVNINANNLVISRMIESSIKN